MLTLEKFKQASEIVKEVTLPTKLVYSEYLSNQTGAEVYLKPENMQYTGAYKVRGAYYKISTMSEENRKKGLVTASAGNHAQGVAYAAKKFGCKATVVMPTVTPLIKVNRTKSYGAEVVLHGDVYDDACAYAMKLAEENGYTFVHPFDDLDVATGQGSIAMEIFDELPSDSFYYADDRLYLSLIHLRAVLLLPQQHQTLPMPGQSLPVRRSAQPANGSPILLTVLLLQHGMYQPLQLPLSYPLRGAFRPAFRSS